MAGNSDEAARTKETRKIVSVSMSGRDREKLLELAARHGVSVSAFLTSLIRERHGIEFGGSENRKNG